MPFHIHKISTKLFDKSVELLFPEKYLDIYGPKFSIFIGKNGSGKSMLFRQITKLFNDGNLDECRLTYTTEDDQKNEYNYKDKVKLIAVTAIMSDKYIFPSKKKNDLYIYCGPKVTSNSAQISGIINRVVENLNYIFQDPKKVKVLREFLDAYGYQKKITIQYSIYNHKNRIEKFSEKDNYYNKATKKYEITFNLDENKIKKPSLDKLLELTEVHKIKETKKRIVQRAELIIIPDQSKQSFELSEASSGQLTIIYTVLNILAHIDNNTIILIDEPETSLHPNWQINFIQSIYEFFKNWNCHFLIATHSHFIVSDLNPTNSNIFKVDAGGAKEYEGDPTYGWNAEDILRDIFETVGSRSKHVYEKINEYLKQIQENKPLSTKQKQEIQQFNLPKNDPLYKIVKILQKYKKVNS